MSRPRRQCQSAGQAQHLRGSLDGVNAAQQPYFVKVHVAGNLQRAPQINRAVDMAMVTEKYLAAPSAKRAAIHRVIAVNHALFQGRQRDYGLKNAAGRIGAAHGAVEQRLVGVG